MHFPIQFISRGAKCLKTENIRNETQREFGEILKYTARHRAWGKPFTLEVCFLICKMGVYLDVP